MEEYHKVDKNRISMLMGDDRSVEDMEAILGMPIPELNASHMEIAKRKPGKIPDEVKIQRMTPPDESDQCCELNFPSRLAAKEFSWSFNECLLRFMVNREREYEAGELTYRHRGIRFFHMYCVYCERNKLKMRKALWDGSNKVTFYLPSIHPVKSA